MTQVIFDGGIFISMIVIGFACLAFYKKIGAVILVVSILSFLVSGLVVVTGEDVAFYKQSNPVNMTVTSTNGTLTTTTTYHHIVPANETDYLIGNGQFPITGIGQMWMGYSMILLSLIIGVIFLDQTLKGNLVKGD